MTSLEQNSNVILLSSLFPNEAVDNLEKDIILFFSKYKLDYFQDHCQDKLIKILSPLNDLEVFNQIEENKEMFFELFYIFLKHLFPNEYIDITKSKQTQNLHQLIKFLSKMMWILIDKHIYFEYINVYSSLFNILSIYCICSEDIKIYEQLFDYFVESKTWDKMSIYLTQTEYDDSINEEEKAVYSIILQKAIFVIFNSKDYYDILYKHNAQLIEFIDEKEIIIEPLGLLILFIVEIAINNQFYNFIPETIDSKVLEYKKIFEKRDQNRYLADSRFLSFLLCLQLKIKELSQ